MRCSNSGFGDIEALVLCLIGPLSVFSNIVNYAEDFFSVVADYTGVPVWAS